MRAPVAGGKMGHAVSIVEGVQMPKDRCQWQPNITNPHKKVARSSFDWFVMHFCSLFLQQEMAPNGTKTSSRL